MRMFIPAIAAALLAAPATAAPLSRDVPGAGPARLLPASPGLPRAAVRPGRLGPVVVRPGRAVRPYGGYGLSGAGLYGSGLYGAAGYGGYEGFPSGLFGYDGPRDVHDLDITRGSAVAPGAPGNYRAQVGSPVIYAIEGRGRRGRSLRACGEQLVPLAPGEDGGATLTRVTLC